jgi:hypothetical protein
MSTASQSQMPSATLPPPSHGVAVPCLPQVEQYGRLPSHIFMDYCITYLLFATACALTLGQLGPSVYSPMGQSLQFLDQLTQQNWPIVLFAIAGGTCLALGGEGGARNEKGVQDDSIWKHQRLVQTVSYVEPGGSHADCCAA